MRAVLLVLTSLLLSLDAFAQNLSRVEAIQWPRPNYEICLGSDPVEPIVVVRNLDVMPRNLRAIVRIVNEVTNIRVYGDTVIIAHAPADLQLTQSFKPFFTNPNILSQLGRFRLIASVDVVDPEGHPLVEGDTTDNKQWINTFGLRRTVAPFLDWVNNYSVLHPELGGQAVPDQHKWISHGLTAVDGYYETFDPPSPIDADGEGFGPHALVAPILMFDRLDVHGNSYDGSIVGDTLSSYPINIRGSSRIDVAFNFHRSRKRSYAFDHDHSSLSGPESTILNADGSIAHAGDSLILEFRHPADSTCGELQSRWIKIAALDGGKDLEWQRFVLRLDSVKLGRNYSTENFRVRLRLLAKSDAGTGRSDDDDAWFVDNLTVARYGHQEYTAHWVRAVTPYTKISSSQAIIPIYLSASMLPSTFYRSDVPVVTRITDTSGATVFVFTDTIWITASHDTIQRVALWDASNVLLAHGNQFTVTSWLPEWYDYNSDDNLVQSTFYLNIARNYSASQEFALDDGTNDIPQLTQQPGAGVGFNNTSGSYAIRFELTKPDTLFGARMLFGAMNSSLDAIRITVHRGGDSSDLPSEIVEGAMVETVRSAQDWDKFASYPFTQPVAAPAGVYWLSVSQLSLDNMILGADASRSGYDMIVSGGSPSYKYIHDSPYGTQYTVNANSGDISRAVAFEIPAGSGNWKPLTPENSMDSTLGYHGWSGTHIPMIRPLVGNDGPLASVNTQHKHSTIAAYPNPFIRGSDVVSFSGTASTGRAVINNLLGQPIRTLPKIDSGWDGKDDYGMSVAPGAYIIAFDSGESILLFAR